MTGPAVSTPEATSEATLEAALEAIERDADAALRVLAAATKEAKRLKAAASMGQLRDVQSCVDSLQRLASSAADAALDAKAGWRFDVTSHFESDGFTKELLAAIAELGVRAVESDQRVLCYPSIVQISAGDASVLIDKTRERRVRPSVLAKQLADRQQRPPKFKPDAFLQTLAGAYDLVATRSGAVVKLADVYAVLTLLPGAARDYTKAEFARDLYLLDQSGETTTKNGRSMSLPASALTRSAATLTTVTRSGQTKVYAGLAFTDGSAA